MPRPRGLPKTGGRKKGTGNKERIVVPEVLPPGTADSMLAEAVRAVAITTSPVRLPKAVMLDAMARFETIGLGLLDKADRLMKTRADPAKIASTAWEGHKFIVAAVECANKVAHYVHAPLKSIESRGDNTQEQAPFVVRTPMVAENSAAWQQAVGVAASVMAEQDGSGASAVPVQPALPHPALPQPVASTPEPPTAPPQPEAVVLVADQKTGKISRAMPVGQVVIKPSGSQEWLETVTASRKAG